MKTKRNRTYKKCLTKHRKTMRQQILIILLVALAAGIIGHQSLKQPYSVDLTTKTALTGHLPENKDKKVLTVQDKIIIAARKAGVDESQALKIAACESGFQPRVRNQQGSSATGIFQFVARTWFDYCEGDVKNADDNINCFAKLYPKHPEWWACHFIVLAKK